MHDVWTLGALARDNVHCEETIALQAEARTLEPARLVLLRNNSTLSNLVQASVWATPWTVLQANYSNGPITGYFANYQAQGCPATNVSAQAPGQQRCSGPWNRPLSTAQMAQFEDLYTTHLIKDYGWDEA